MSSNLYWEPADRGKNKCLGTALKGALQKRFGYPVRVTLDERNVPYLEGLVDADIKDAQGLIDAIEKHGRIDLREEF